MQLDLFSPDGSKMEQQRNTNYEIPGLSLMENYLSLDQERVLIRLVDGLPWLEDLKRRVQHYGYKYDYRFRKIDLSMKIGPLPGWAQQLAIRMRSDGYFKDIPDQLIVNEYLPGQGIAPHIDCKPCFEDSIVSISLWSDVIMDLAKNTTKRSIHLPARSLLALQGESRYEWTHGIRGRKRDLIDGHTRIRRRRVSLTFRRVVLQ